MGKDKKKHKKKNKGNGLPKRYLTGNGGWDSAKRYLYKRIDQITPNIYAAFALVLSRIYGWKTEKIAELFAETQKLWAESVADNRNMAQICYDELGIDVRAGAEQPIEDSSDYLVGDEEE